MERGEGRGPVWGSLGCSHSHVIQRKKKQRGNRISTCYAASSSGNSAPVQAKTADKKGSRSAHVPSKSWPDQHVLVPCPSRHLLSTIPTLQTLGIGRGKNAHTDAQLPHAIAHSGRFCERLASCRQQQQQQQQEEARALSRIPSILRQPHLDASHIFQVPFPRQIVASKAMQILDSACSPKRWHTWPHYINASAHEEEIWPERERCHVPVAST